jgi:hypothetical protein
MDAIEGLDFGRLAYGRRLFTAAARLSTASFRSDPKLAEDMRSGHRYNDMRSGHRYNAACAAVLASAGQGDEKSPMNEPEKARWRKQALEWLRADLAHWTNQVQTGKPEAKALVSQKLQHWKEDLDLAGIRISGELAKLSESEQKAYQALWADVEALLKQAQEQTPHDRQMPPGPASSPALAAPIRRGLKGLVERP